MAYVASGRYDGYFQKNLKIWDIAAGIILIKEAGGVINEINLDKIEDLNVIASSPNISAKFKEKLVTFNCFKKTFAISLVMKKNTS